MASAALIPGTQERHQKLSRNEIEAALLDPTIFIHEHCFIRGKGGKTERFRLWDFQREVVECFDDEEKVLVLKARQLGISWCADGFALWLCTANVGQTVMILSVGQREAKEELRRIRFMHERLPPELRRRTGADMTDAHAPDTTEQLEFPDMDSRIVSLPSTEHAGTSYTATLMIIHELAKIQTAPTLITSVIPTIADGGKFFIVSTAEGYSGTFYDYWRDHGIRWHTGQIVGDPGEEGSFRPIFIPWHVRPGRDQKWYEATERGLGPRRARQEYPASPKDAWGGSMDSVFAKEFDRHTHGIDGSRHPRSPHPVVHGMDLGLNHAYSYLIEIQGRNAFVFAEIHLQDETVEDLGKATVDMDKEFGLDASEVVSYPDPAGISRNLQTLRTDYDVLQECGLLVDKEAMKVSPAQRVDLIKKMLKQGRLWVSLDCPDLLDALERAPWKTRRGANGLHIREDTYAKDGVYEHPLDAMGYALSQVFPPLSAAAVETQTSGAGVAASIGSYSGSEFGG